MADFNIRSDSVNVDEIMRQIRARIREKRGVDYTEQEIRELAEVKLETFLDPSKVRSDLLEQYRRLQRDQAKPDVELDEESLFGSPRPWLRRVRRLLRPILKLFINPVPLMRAARVDTVRHAELFYELMHNLVIETTRLGIEVKNLKMRVESLSSRLDFDERRARALEGTVQYRQAAGAPAPAGASEAPAASEEEEEGGASESVAARSRRRRRRRGRRGGQRPGGEEPSAALTGGGGQTSQRSPDGAPGRGPGDVQPSGENTAAEPTSREADRQQRADVPREGEQTRPPETGIAPGEPGDQDPDA